MKKRKKSNPADFYFSNWITATHSVSVYSGNDCAKMYRLLRYSTTIQRV